MSSMDLIKQLREATGSGIVDCKKALLENNDDLDAAVKWLREKGILKAQKKQNRATNEGVISLFNQNSLNSFTVCKINCETDFVAKNNDFLSFAESLTKKINESKDLKEKGNFEDLGPLSVDGKDIKTALTDLITKIGENIQIVSYKKYNSDNSIFVSYLHNKYNNNCSKIAAVVEIKTDNFNIASKIIDDLKVIPMQVTAMKPLGLDENSIDKKILNDEKDIILKQMENIPENKKELILNGKLSKFIKENTLLGQSLITEPKKSVSDFIIELSKNNKIELNIISMDLYII